MTKRGLAVKDPSSPQRRSRRLKANQSTTGQNVDDNTGDDSSVDNSSNEHSSNKKPRSADELDNVVVDQIKEAAASQGAEDDTDASTNELDTAVGSEKDDKETEEACVSDDVRDVEASMTKDGCSDDGQSTSLRHNQDENTLGRSLMVSIEHTMKYKNQHY